MAESKRGQETMKLTMKMGGGGIGAVVLLGGALATAALASAFVVGRNGRSSGHKRTPAPEINRKQSPSSGETKEVESDKDNVFVVSNQESTLDANLIVKEINCETPDILCSISPKKLETDAISNGLIVIEEKVPSLDGKLQFEPQNDDGALTIEFTKDDADDENPKESQDPDEKVIIEEKRTEIEPTDEYVGEVRATSHREAVEITEKQPREEEYHDEVCCDGQEEEIKVILVDDKEVEMKSDNLEERHVIDNGEMVFSETDSEDGHNAVQPVLESHVIEHEHVNGDEKKEILEIVNQRDELIVVKEHESHVIEHEQVNGDGKKEIVEIESQHNEPIVGEKRDSHVIEHEHVNGDEKKEIVEIVNQPDELIVGEKHEDPIEVKVEDIIPCDVKEEENACLVYPMLKESDLEGDIIEKEVEEEVMISPEYIEVVESVEANMNDTSLEFDVVQTENNEVVESIEANMNDTSLEFDVVQTENNEVVESIEANINETSLEFVVVQEKQNKYEDVEEIEGSSETIAIENDDSVTEKSEDETVLSDEACLVDQEVGGKIQEDKAVKKGECDSKDSRMIDDDLSFEHVHQEKSESDFGNSEKTFTIKKYAMNDRLTNSTDRRIIIVILSLVSSLSCSWFFGLSSAELCLVVFLTMVMSSMVVE